MKIYSVNDEKFKKYGKVINIEANELINAAEKIKYPDKGSAYIPSVEDFEKLAAMKYIQNTVFGGMPTQLGFCYGYNNTLTAMEWHKCSEVNIATEDIILLLGDIRDIEAENRYNSDNVEAFILKKGEAIEIFATTLHYCPIQTKKTGFGCIIGLLKETNTPLEELSEDALILQKNKWLICHPESKELVDKGAVAGIYGENFVVE